MSDASESPPDTTPSALAHAVRELLLVAGLDPDREDLDRTPERVARMWTDLVLSGYRVDPAELLGDPIPAEGQTHLVVVRDVPCHGMCPHHLMPWVGSATVAYLPTDKIAGFGRLGDLVHCFTRRLTLQEQACHDVADALMTHLDARGAGCVITGQHNCLNVPGDKHRTRVVTASFRGELDERPDLQARLIPGA